MSAPAPAKDAASPLEEVAARRPRSGARLPPELRLLLTVVALLGVTWSVILPPWQGPDEPAHFAYVQGLAESFRLPGNPALPAVSVEQENAEVASNGPRERGNPEAKPPWSRRLYDEWKRSTADHSRQAGGSNPADPNPPLYYLLEVPAYRLAGGLDVNARLYLMRLVSVGFLVLTVLLAWAAAREVFPGEPLLQLIAAAVAGLPPMVTFVFSIVTPDALLITLWTAVIWMGLRIIRRGVSVRRAAALCAFGGLAMVTKQSSYALLPALLFVLAYGVWRLRTPRAAMRPLLAAGLAVSVPVGIWLVVAAVTDRAVAGQVSQVAPSHGAPLNVREFASYVWQFYLPRPSFLTPFPPLGAGHPPMAWEMWIKQSVGAFGWLEVRYPPWIYSVAALLGLFVVVGAVVAAIRRRSAPWAALTFAALLAVSLLAGLHWTEYRLAVSGEGLFNQARYLFVLVAFAGLVAAQAARALPRAWQPTFASVLFGVLLVLQIAGLGIVAARYYAA